MFGLDETFDYCECPRCGTLYIQHIPRDLSDYYTTKYYSFDVDPEAVLGRPGVAQMVRAVGRSILFGRGSLGAALARVPDLRVQALVNKFRSVAVADLRLHPDSRILDVGTGAGVLVYALSQAGLRDVVGIDPFAAADATFDTGARLLKRELGEMDGQFDLVMLHHSLEHVTDPGETLGQARKRLAPGGRVVVRIPTVTSEVYERYGVDWYGMDAPRHLTLFSREGLSGLAVEAGFSVRKVVDDSIGVQFWASEQVRAGIPFASERSYLRNPRRSIFSRSELRSWERRAQQLNAAGRGEQAAWVLTAS